MVDDEPRPDLTIVVVNDDGGGIFSTLEYGEPSRAADFERVFGTPTGTDLAALCAAHGVGHVLAGSADELAAEVGAAPQGLRVVEVRVDRATHRQAHADLRALAAATLTPDAKMGSGLTFRHFAPPAARKAGQSVGQNVGQNVGM